jgi:hypothetical protein
MSLGSETKRLSWELSKGQGLPMVVSVAGAKRHDMKLRAETLEAVVVVRP